MKSAGLYEIINSVNGMRYVGSALDVSKRLRSHRRMLDSGRHENGHLQRAWIRYGESAFEFRTLVRCDSVTIRFFEQRALDYWRTVGWDRVYNIAFDADAPGTCLKGRPKPHGFGEKVAAANRRRVYTQEMRERCRRPHREHSDEEKKQRGAAMKRKWREPAYREMMARRRSVPFNGPHADETKRKISESLKRAYAEGRRH